MSTSQIRILKKRENSMQALILAAGMGTRLKEYTKDAPKCMVSVNGVTIIERVLRQLEKNGVTHTIVVTGYKAELLKACILNLNINMNVGFIKNSFYDSTNNIYSLWLARETMIKDDTILLESDLVLDDSILKNLIKDKRENVMVVDKYEDWMDGTCVKINSDGSINKFISSKTADGEELKDSYKTVNVYKISRKFSSDYLFEYMERYMEQKGKNDYYENVISVINEQDNSLMKAEILNGDKWYEIDNESDLKAASELF